MFTKRSFFLLFTVVAIVAAGAITVSAQDTTTPVPPIFGGRGQGMMIQSRLLWDGDSAPMYAAIADALGIDQQTLITELQSGKTLAQLATEYGVNLDSLTATLQTATQTHMQAMIDAGLITQAQADAHLALMADHWDDMPMLNGTSYNYMMGAGRGGMWNGDSSTGMMGSGMLGGSGGARGGMGRGR